MTKTVHWESVKWTQGFAGWAILMINVTVLIHFDMYVINHMTIISITTLFNSKKCIYIIKNVTCNMLHNEIFERDQFRMRMTIPHSGVGWAWVILISRFFINLNSPTMCLSLTFKVLEDVMRSEIKLWGDDEDIEIRFI